MGGGGGGGGGGSHPRNFSLRDSSLFLGGKLDGCCCFFIPWFKAHYLIVATVLSASARVSPSSDLTQ